MLANNQNNNLFKFSFTIFLHFFIRQIKIISHRIIQSLPPKLQLLQQMSEKFDPISTLISFQHQANHYKNIVKPRKTASQSHSIDHQANRKQLNISQFECKFEKQKRESIRKENQRIFTDIFKIQNKKGILQNAQQQFRAIQSQNTRKRSLVNQFKANEERDRIKKQNLKMQMKISFLKPIVGNKNSWKEREDFNIKLVNKLSKRSAHTAKTFTGQRIMKLIVNVDAQRINGGLKLFKTLNLQNKSFFQTNTGQIKTKTARSSRRRRPRQVSKDKSKKDQSLQNQETHK